ncbi:hypothetical protein LTR84_008315 [Exophiala bonariae]|uniref:BZIP domain-containing protein n=1 Tax=Exophiala bonariae TaxID=1690606 RepID=A0AAV9MXT5_9EURO|nr:hypothetical protein LTR84_008315 [Exophiala bonariae]
MANVEELPNQPATRYKRKLTDARREQNRRAQKLWRERQKKQRDEDVKSKVLQQLTELDTEAHDEVQNDSAWSAEVVQSTNGRVCPNTLPLESTVALDFAPVDMNDPVIMQFTPEHTTISPEALPSLPDPDMPLPMAIYYYVPPDPTMEDMRFAWPVDGNIWQKMYTKPPAFRPAGSSIQPTTSSSFSRDHSESASYPIDPFSTDIAPTPRSSNDGLLPSLYLNHLQLVGESCFAATLSIAQCLAISRASYINDHPSPFTTASNSTISLIPPDLRPSGVQLLLPHPCYLDCIPFPHFRNIAIYLSSLKKLDHCSLFLDLMHDGLVCWGRARANGRHRRSMRDGVAWSKRSWEARPWFWRKWGWLARLTIEEIDSGSYSEREIDDDVDDEDGMLSGSQWWWSQQADDDVEDSLMISNSSTSGSSSRGAIGNQGREEYGSMLSRVVVCNVGIRNKEDIYPWD